MENKRFDFIINVKVKSYFLWLLIRIYVTLVWTTDLMYVIEVENRMTNVLTKIYSISKTTFSRFIICKS